VQFEWIRKYSCQGKPTHRSELLHNDDFDIIAQYGDELRGLVNYYTMAINARPLQRIKYTMMASLVKTLAHKHKESAAMIYRKYYTVFENGISGISIKIARDGKPSLIAKFGETPIRYQRMAKNINDERWLPKPGRTQLIDRLTAETCELCGAQGDMEIHHVQKLADLKKIYRHKQQPAWVTWMVSRKRKTIAVCHNCHVSIHNGTYDGIAITS
jgi:hypothetical protein